MKYIFIFALLLSERAGAEDVIAEPANMSHGRSVDVEKCIGGDGKNCPKDTNQLNFQVSPYEVDLKFKENMTPRGGVKTPEQLKSDAQRERDEGLDI